MTRPTAVLVGLSLAWLLGVASAGLVATQADARPAPAALLRAYLRDESAREGQCRGQRPRVIVLVEEGCP